MKNLLKFRIKLFIINLFFIMIVMFGLSSNLKILICTIAKQENKYINEFIEHYRNLKINKIIIYDNNNINGENFEDILKKDIKSKFIKIINIRGLQQPQFMALNKCYKKFNKYYDWIAFFDIDEFLYVNNFTNLKKFLSLPKFSKCQSIIINWKYYGDNNKLYYEPKPLKERFIKKYDIEKIKINEINIYYYSAAKSIIRGGLKLKWGLFPHYIENSIKCKPDGTILNNYFSPPQYSFAYINHYITKSTEEFIERLNRGDVMIKPDSNYTKDRIFNYYFLFNQLTKEKLDLFRKKNLIK